MPKQRKGDQQRYLDILAKFDLLEEEFLNDIEEEKTQAIEKIESSIKEFKTRIPNRLLNTTLGEIKSTGDNTFLEIVHHINEACSYEVNPKFPTPAAHVPCIRKKSRDHAPTRMGPLQAARNRSRSSSTTRGRIPLARGNSDQAAMHQSRLKYRDPIVGRQKAASADRVKIVPKTSGRDGSVSFLRPVRRQESIYSLNGSPLVFDVGAVGPSLNIPLKDGFVTIKSTPLESVDDGLIKQLDMSTMEQLKNLKKNIRCIVKQAEPKK